MIKTLLRFSIVLLGLFFLPFFVKAQSCVTSSRNYWEWPAHNNWYIGTYPATWTEQAHIINFSAGFSVTTRGNGTIANAMYSYEGITTASDDKGNLIVFSNGIKAWNNAGVQTSSTIGEGTEGVGTVGSASQGIISVRHPLDPNKYYFIATADVLGPELKTTYNVFDQTGTQVQGNTNLPGNIAANEGITATMHQNGVDIWVVVAQKSSTNIQAWLLTCEGFVNNPVTSPVGVSFSSDAARGGIALSHDGKKLASLFGGSGVQQISMYDFNNGTGVVSNRQDVGPCCSFARGYDVVFSKDNSGLVVGSWGVQGAFYFNIASKTVTTITGPDAQHHAVEIGADGIYYFKGKDGLWTWTGSGAATKVGGAVGNASGQGLPTMYMPPVEEPDIKEVGPFCTTDPVIDLSTTWICSRVNSEDTLNWVAPSAQYSGVGITNTTRGFFNPATAGPGLHKIIFKKCAVDDTITIEVKNCSSCNVILKNTKPEICVGQSIKLDSLVLANNGTGVWKIDSVPLTSGISATLSNGATDTLFNTTEASKTGTYKLMLTNTYMGTICKDSIYIVVNLKPDVTVNSTAICPGASATFTATTTATSPSYLWKFNGTVITGATSATTTGSVAGNYTVQIIDNKTCKDTATGVLKINALPVITVRDTAICNGDAAVSFKATSDTTAASYLWSENSTVTTQTATGKTPGNYTVKVTDKNGCIASKTAVLTVNTKPDVTVNSTAICQGASATFTATTSATSPTYLWKFNGTAITGGTSATTTGAVAGSYTVQIIDNNSCKDTASGVLKINALPVITVRDTAICSGDAAVSFKATSDSTAASYLWTENSTVTTQTATGKTAGNYTVKVTDKNGCIASKTAVLTVNSKPDVTVNKAAICPGASATFTATTTATSPSYLWKFNGTAIVGSTASSATGSVAGNYTVEIIDNKSCKDTATGVLKINALPVITVRDTAICSGDAAVSFKATSDSTAASYLWSENSTVTTQTATGKTAGNYTVKVTDKNGCIASKTAVLTVNTKPDVTVNNAAICPGATATFTATTTATSPSYLWKYNGTAVTGGNTATTTGTVAGNYTVQIIDNKTCKDTATGVLTLNSIPTPDVIADVTICPGMSQTFDVVSFNNGNGPFTYKWKDGSTGSSINVGTAGTYYVDITDKNGCVGRDQAVLGINSNLNVKIAGAPTINICEGETAVLKSNYNKVDGYNFSWKPGNETTETISVTTAGKYDLHVDNGLGCQGDGTVNVVVNLKPIVADGTASICSGESATIGNNVGAGNTYVWKSLTETTYQVTVTTGGTYERVVTTSANCKDSSEYVVTENANPIVTINDVTKCEGENVTLSDPSLSTGYNYSWSNGATSASISPTTSGSHTLSVTNSSTGCKGSDQATVTFISIPVVDLGPDTIPICDGEQAIVDAGNAGLTITWSNGATTPAITMTTTGLYSVTVTNGTCPTIDQVYLDVQAVPVSGLNKLLEDERFCFESLENGVTLSAGTNNSYTYLWNTGDRTADLIIEEPGMYTVEISVGNCAIADQITISEFCPYSIFVPNAVSPNGDGVNDIFYAKGHHIIDYQMTIFDRWGLEIYTVKDMEKGWDCKYKGNLVQIDVYVWKISYTYETVDGAIKEGNQVGTVTVVE